MVIVLERGAVMLEDKVTVLEKVVEVQDYEKKVLQRRVEMMGKMEQRKEQEEMDDMQQSEESYNLRDRVKWNREKNKKRWMTCNKVERVMTCGIGKMKRRRRRRFQHLQLKLSSCASLSLLLSVQGKACQPPTAPQSAQRGLNNLCRTPHLPTSCPPSPHLNCLPSQLVAPPASCVHLDHLRPPPVCWTTAMLSHLAQCSSPEPGRPLVPTSHPCPWN